MAKRIGGNRTVMRIAQQAAVVEVVCLVDGLPVRIRLTPGSDVGRNARKRFVNMNKTKLGEKLLKVTHALSMNYVQKKSNIDSRDLSADIQPLLLELVRRADVLDEKLFLRDHTYCIVCTCTVVDDQTLLFHVAGLMDTTSIIMQQTNTEGDDITRRALQLIGSNAEYYDNSQYDGNVALQELKDKSGGIHTCNCGMCSRTFVCVRVVPDGWH